MSNSVTEQKILNLNERRVNLVKDIVEFLTTDIDCHPERSELWDILTALRGPDFSDWNGETKAATTAVIRYKLGLRDGENAAGAICEPDSPKKVEFRKNLIVSGASWHFVSHAQNAFNALDLKWNELNEL